MGRWTPRNGFDRQTWPNNGRQRNGREIETENDDNNLHPVAQTKHGPRIGRVARKSEARRESLCFQAGGGMEDGLRGPR